MSDPRPTPAPVQRFTLTPPPPVRPMAIAAGTVVVAVVLLVLWRSAELPLVVGVLGALLLLLGVALAVAALVLTARLRAEVLLEADGVTVVRRGRRRSLTWDAVDSVTMEHPRLTLVASEPSQSLVVVNPRPATDRRFASLAGTLTDRLDRERGYRDLV